MLTCGELITAFRAFGIIIAVRAVLPIFKTHSPSNQYPLLTTPPKTYALNKTTFSIKHLSRFGSTPPSPLSQCSFTRPELAWSVPSTQRTTLQGSYHQLMQTSLRKSAGRTWRLLRLPSRSRRVFAREVLLCLSFWGGWSLAATEVGCSVGRRLEHQTVLVLSIGDLVSYREVVNRLLMFGRKGRGRAE